MFCSKCGASNSDDASFCVQCGGPLKSQPSAISSQQPQPANAGPSVPQGSRKSPLVAGFLNLFFGLGYLYLGYKKVLGLPALLFVLLALIIFILLGSYTVGLLSFVLAILLAYDGYVKAKGEKGYVSTEPALLYQ